jgi:hypothetical protein
MQRKQWKKRRTGQKIWRPDDSEPTCKKKLSALSSDNSAPSFYRFGTNPAGVNFFLSVRMKYKVILSLMPRTNFNSKLVNEKWGSHYLYLIT